MATQINNAPTTGIAGPLTTEQVAGGYASLDDWYAEWIAQNPPQPTIQTISQETLDQAVERATELGKQIASSPEFPAIVEASVTGTLRDAGTFIPGSGDDLTGTSGPALDAPGTVGPNTSLSTNAGGEIVSTTTVSTGGGSRPQPGNAGGTATDLDNLNKALEDEIADANATMEDAQDGGTTGEETKKTVSDVLKDILGGALESTTIGDLVNIIGTQKDPKDPLKETVQDDTGNTIEVSDLVIPENSDVDLETVDGGGGGGGNDAAGQPAADGEPTSGNPPATDDAGDPLLGNVGDVSVEGGTSTAPEVDPPAGQDPGQDADETGVDPLDLVDFNIDLSGDGASVEADPDNPPLTVPNDQTIAVVPPPAVSTTDTVVTAPEATRPDEDGYIPGGADEGGDAFGGEDGDTGTGTGGDSGGQGAGDGEGTGDGTGDGEGGDGDGEGDGGSGVGDGGGIGDGIEPTTEEPPVDPTIPGNRGEPTNVLGSGLSGFFSKGVVEDEHRGVPWMRGK